MCTCSMRLVGRCGVDRISRALGVTGRAVSTRMLGIILAALAVQFMVDGITELASI